MRMGSSLGGLGSSLAPFWSQLVSFWVPRACKMEAAGYQADIVKTYENRLFFMILECWKVDNAHFGGLGDLLA